MGILAELVFHAMVASTAFWFIISGGSWLATAAFAMSNLAGLLIFHSRFHRGHFYLRRNWEAGIAILTGAVLTLFPALLDIGSVPYSTARAVGCVAVFMLVRASFSPAPVDPQKSRLGKRRPMASP
jgi:hypothetical protein